MMKAQKVSSFQNREWRTRGGAEVWLYPFFNLRWGWAVNATSRPLYPWERPGIHCIGGWVGPRAGLEVCGKSHPTRFRTAYCPARSD